MLLLTLDEIAQVSGGWNWHKFLGVVEVGVGVALLATTGNPTLIAVGTAALIAGAGTAAGATYNPPPKSGGSGIGGGGALKHALA